MENKGFRAEGNKMTDEEIFKDVVQSVQELKPEVRQKAVEFIQNLIKEGADYKEALPKGIQQAEAWYLEMQG